MKGTVRQLPINRLPETRCPLLASRVAVCSTSAYLSARLRLRARGAALHALFELRLRMIEKCTNNGGTTECTCQSSSDRRLRTCKANHLPQSQVAPLPNSLPFRLVSKTIGSGAYASYVTLPWWS